MLVSLHLTSSMVLYLKPHAFIIAKVNASFGPLVQSNTILDGKLTYGINNYLSLFIDSIL